MMIKSLPKIHMWSIFSGTLLPNRNMRAFNWMPKIIKFNSSHRETNNSNLLINFQDYSDGARSPTGIS